MTIKLCLSIFAIAAFFASCLKESIPDAMLAKSGNQAVTATLKYEINGEQVTVVVKDARNQGTSGRRLSCEKSSNYVLSAVVNAGDFAFTFFTDSLQAGNYKYTSNYGPMYVTNFEGRAQYVYGPTDNMDFNVTSYKDGYISGNFSGQLTPSIAPGIPNNIYGTMGSVTIKNGSFTNVPVFY